MKPFLFHFFVIIIMKGFFFRSVSVVEIRHVLGVCKSSEIKLTVITHRLEANQVRIFANETIMKCRPETYRRDHYCQLEFDNNEHFAPAVWVPLVDIIMTFCWLGMEFRRIIVSRSHTIIIFLCSHKAGVCCELLTSFCTCPYLIPWTPPS